MSLVSSRVLNSYTWINDFGVVPSLTPEAATVDYTTQVQEAVNATRGTLIVPGWVKITGQINVPIGCILHVPSGSQTGGFAISTDFNMAAFAVVFAAGGVGWEIGDFGFSFTQAAAASSGLRGDIIQYPRAIGFAANSTRPKIGNIYIANGWDGIIADGNQGGMNTQLLEGGCFNRSFFVNGAKDFVTIGRIHHWQFGASDNVNLATIHNDGQSIALDVRDCDGFGIENLVVHNARVIVNNSYAANPGDTSGSFIPHHFGRVTMDGGVGRFYWQRGWGLMNNYSGQDLFEVSGGFLNMAGPKFIGAATPLISVTGGEVFISGADCHLRAVTNIGFQVSGTGVMAIEGVKVRGRAGTRTAPVFKQVGSNSVIRVGGVFSYSLSAAHPIIEVDADRAEHFVDLTGAKYYTVSLPASRPLGTYILPPT